MAAILFLERKRIKKNGMGVKLGRMPAIQKFPACRILPYMVESL
jgi:hypothetical protein